MVRRERLADNCYVTEAAGHDHPDQYRPSAKLCAFAGAEPDLKLILHTGVEG